MRQGQQNRRGRGRNNNNNNGGGNRKSQNPLTRSFESAGPDVKIRGTPSHIAEKYISLARDALSSGDRVLAENYLQHAEHYNRIILGVREQQMSQGGGDPFNSGMARTHSLNSTDPNDGDDFSDEEGGGDDMGGQSPMAAGGAEGGGQPSFQQQPRFDQPQQQRFDNRPRHNNQPRHDRGEGRFDRGDRPDRGQDRGPDRGQDRGDRQDFRGRDRGDRPQHDRNGGERGYRDDRRFGGPQGEGQQQAGEGGSFRRRDRFPDQQRERFQDPNAQPPQAQPPIGFEPGNVAPVPVAPPVVAERVMPERAAAPQPSIESEQPAFLRRPVRRPRREEPVEAAAAPAPRAPKDEQD